MNLEEILKKLEDSLKKVASEDKEELQTILAEFKENKKEETLVELQGKIDALLSQQADQDKKKDEPKSPNRKIEFTDGKTKDVKNIEEIMKSQSVFLNDAEKELRSFVDNAYIMASLLKVNPRNLKMWQKFEASRSALKSAMDTATAEEGAEWIPTALSADVIERYRLAARVPALFKEINMPTNPFKLPTDLAALTFYLIPESTSSEPSKTPTTVKKTGDLTLTAVKFRARVVWSEELNEDSIVAILPIVKKNIVEGGALAVEDAIINGDTTAPHQDSDVTDSKDHRKAWKGLRKLNLAAADEDMGGVAVTDAKLRTVLSDMGKYGITPSELTWITGPSGYNGFRGLTNLFTVDKYGPKAVILTGEVGKYMGSPIILSEKIREDLDATGVYGAALTHILVVNRGAFIIGNRGAWKLTADFDNDVDQYVLNVRFRKDFIPIYAAATEPIIGELFNVL